MLRLTASDSEFETYDEVTITVENPPGDFTGRQHRAELRERLGDAIGPVVDLGRGSARATDPRVCAHRLLPSE